MAAVMQSLLLDEDEEARARDCGGVQYVCGETLEEQLSRMTVLEEKAVEVMGDHGVNGPVLSP